MYGFGQKCTHLIKCSFVFSKWRLYYRPHVEYLLYADMGIEANNGICLLRHICINIDELLRL